MFNFFCNLKNVTKNVCGYLIVVKIVAKTRATCNCYVDGQKPNMYMLIVYIIHGPFGDVMLNHNL